MDLFTVNQDGSRGPQTHDFNPGIPASGLFWTQPVSEESVQNESDQAAALFSVTNLPERDFFNLGNALHGGSSVPATVSFSMLWAPTSPPIEFTKVAQGFTGTFRLSNVLLEWSARTEGFTFVSDPAGTAVTVAGILGEERNGVFFSS
jgi:hypothetical protein